jgi:hypothetical protein
MAVPWHEKLSWFGVFSQYFPSDHYCNLVLAYEFFQCLQPYSPSWNGYLSERDFDPGSSDLLFSVLCLFLTFDAHSPSISCNFHTLQSCLFCLSMRANIANFMSSNSLFFTLCDTFDFVGSLILSILKLFHDCPQQFSATIWKFLHPI